MPLTEHLRNMQKVK